MNKIIWLLVLSLVFACNISVVSALSLPTLVDSFPAPVAAAQLSYSKQYGLLFLRNSGSEIQVVDATTHNQIDLHVANQQFTDMDLDPTGQYLYAADWGGVSTGYGTLINPHYVHRYNLASRQWETKRSFVDTYKIEAIDPDRVALLESDQWVDINLERWGNGSTMTHLASGFGDYYGDIEYDAATGRIYHGNSGSSSREINVLQLVGDTLTYAMGTGTYGTAQTGGGTSVLSLNGSTFYYGALQVDALDVTHNLRTFPQLIYAATDSLAFGTSATYNAQTGATLGSFGYYTTVYGLNPSGSDLWSYANGTLYHYALVPEPTSCLLFASLFLPLTCSRRFRRARVCKLGTG